MIEPYYEHAGITIYHGDCREVLPQMPNGVVDAIITDPPYGCGEDYSMYQDTFENWKLLIDVLFTHWRSVTGGGPLFFSTSKIEAEWYLGGLAAYTWRICWYKGASDTRSPIGWKDWELVYVYGKPKRQMHDHFYCGAGGGKVLYRNDHPCPKPLGWAKHLIGKGTCDGDAILDPFMGSGTTLRAAKDLGRRAIGIEIEERYCEIAAERLRQEVLFA